MHQIKSNLFILYVLWNVYIYRLDNYFYFTRLNHLSYLTFINWFVLYGWSIIWIEITLQYNVKSYPNYSTINLISSSSDGGKNDVKFSFKNHKILVWILLFFLLNEKTKKDDKKYYKYSLGPIIIIFYTTSFIFFFFDYRLYKIIY